jgi:hypothetical protein
MQFKDADAAKKWEEGLSKNTDSYGRGVYTYASRWALLMEQKLAEGKKLQEVAEKTSHEADTEGITGYMYGCAVGILATVWVHGEMLRRWHNKEIQIGTEGDEANEKPGAVLSPALLGVSQSN